jgi:transposase-like protein
MRNAKLTLEEKFEVIDLYFEQGNTIKKIEELTPYTKSVIGRVVKHHKEKYLKGDEEYIQYPKHYYKKNIKLINLKKTITALLNKELDLIEERATLETRLAEIEREEELLIEKKYNLLNK